VRRLQRVLRRSAQMADGGECALGAFAALPPAIVLAVLALLPVDARLRCREVCCGWRAALSDVTLWTRLDLSEASGVAAARLEHATGLLVAAALRAGGQLQSLDVTGCADLDFDALRGVVGGSAATLREVLVQGFGWPDRLADLLRAAPRLLLLHAAAIHCDFQGFELLRDEQLFAPLRLRLLAVRGDDDDAELALALRLVAAAAPAELNLAYVDLSAAAAIGAVVDAALAHQMSAVALSTCRLFAATAPALARLLDGGAVMELCVYGVHERNHAPWANEADEAGAALVCDALRANTSLRELTLTNCQDWIMPAAVPVLLRALTGHASLQSLRFVCNNATDAQAAGAALGALVAADTLTELDVSGSWLDDVPLGPLFDALPAVTRLRMLRCYAAYDEGCFLSDAFMRDRALPALRANASLRELTLDASEWPRRPLEAEDLVNSRTDE
jgi:hypothetical protein